MRAGLQEDRSPQGSFEENPQCGNSFEGAQCRWRNGKQRRASTNATSNAVPRRGRTGRGFCRWSGYWGATRLVVEKLFPRFSFTIFEISCQERHSGWVPWTRSKKEKLWQWSLDSEKSLVSQYSFPSSSCQISFSKISADLCNKNGIHCSSQSLLNAWLETKLYSKLDWTPWPIHQNIPNNNQL